MTFPPFLLSSSPSLPFLPYLAHTRIGFDLSSFVFGLFIVSLLICIGFSVASLFWDGANLGGAWYIDIPSADYKPLFKAFVNVLFQFCTFWILFSNIIPISLYVSMEFVKLGASIFLSWDLEMYDEATGGVVVKTSNLIEELGQVNHIFTDKTGTLTENIMTLRKISCSGEAFTCDVMSFANEDSDLLTMSVLTSPPSPSFVLILCRSDGDTGRFVNWFVVRGASPHEARHQERSETALIDYEHSAQSRRHD